MSEENKEVEIYEEETTGTSEEVISDVNEDGNIEVGTGNNETSTETETETDTEENEEDVSGDNTGTSDGETIPGDGDSETGTDGEGEETDPVEPEIPPIIPALIDISTLGLTLVDDEFTYNGKSKVIILNTDTLIQDTDYVLEYDDNPNVGTYTAIVTGVGKYTGTVEFTYVIRPRSITSVDVTSGAPDENDCFDLQNLKIMVDNQILEEKYYNMTLIDQFEDDHYIMQVRLEGKGNYTGLSITSFKTNKIYYDFTKESISMYKNYIYTGEVLKPRLTETLFVEDEDYIILVDNFINVGKYTVIVKGINENLGQFVFEDIMITPKDFTYYDCRIDPIIREDTHTCESDKFTVIVDNQELEQNKDYTLFVNEVGTSLIVVSAVGINNYQGVVSAQFNLEKVYIDINVPEIYIDPTVEYTYTGYSIIPTIVSVLKEDTDYIMIVENNINVSNSAKVTLKGTGDYFGTKEILFSISPKSLTEDIKVNCGNPDENDIYDQNNLVVFFGPVILVKDIDYTLETNQVEQMDGDILTEFSITGIGNYKDTINVSFKTGIVEEDPEEPPVDPEPPVEPEEPEIIIFEGQEVKLKNVKVYARFCSSKTQDIKTGTFYIWDSAIVNRRVRITNNKNKTRVPGHITGWIDIEDLKKDPNKLRIGDKLTISGNLNQYADGSGLSIYKKNATMYITDILSKDNFRFNLGLANTPTGNRIGWGNEEMIKSI